MVCRVEGSDKGFAGSIIGYLTTQMYDDGPSKRHALSHPRPSRSGNAAAIRRHQTYQSSFSWRSAPATRMSPWMMPSPQRECTLSYLHRQLPTHRDHDWPLDPDGQGSRSSSLALVRLVTRYAPEAYFTMTVIYAESRPPRRKPFPRLRPNQDAYQSACPPDKRALTGYRAWRPAPRLFELT